MKKSYLFISFIVVLILFFVLLFFSAHKTDSDEGIILNIAWRFWNGDTRIYTDKFVEYLSPGSALSIYAFWKLLGHPSFAYAKVLVYLLWTISSCGVFLIITTYTHNKKLLLLTLLTWTISVGLTSQINHNPTSSMIAVWLLYVALKVIDKPTSKNFLFLIYLAGFINALVLWYLQTKGTALFLAVIAILFVNKNIKKNLVLHYLISFITSSILLLSISGLKKTIIALFYLPLTLNYLAANKSQPIIIAVLLSATILAFMFFISLHKKRDDLIAISIFQLALFLSITNNYNAAHFFDNLFPTIIFYVIYFSENNFLQKSLANKLNTVLIVISAIFIICVGITNLLGPNIFQNDKLKTFNTTEIIRAKNIYAGPFLAGYYYEAKKTSLFPLSHVDVSNKYYNDLMYEKFIKVKPEIAFIDYESIKKSLHYNTDNPLDNYIQSNYKLCPKKFIQNTSVYVLDINFCP